MNAKNVLAASALLEQGLSDILSLQTEREKIRSAGLLNQQKLTSEALATQYKAAQQVYNTLMASDDKSSDEFKVFADRAWSNLKEIENTYNKFHGIANLPQVSAMKIFQHEISLLPEGMTSWNDSLLEAIKRKPQYADVPEDVWQGVEVIWKASQPDATKAQKKEALTFKQDGSIASGDTSLAYGFDYVPEKINLGGPAFVDDFLNFLKQSSVKRDVSDAQALNIGLETSDERALRMGLPVGNAETSQLLPRSVIDALRQEDKKSIGTGTGGMLSFADDIKLSRKAMEFIRNLAVYENEYGQEQGRKYVSKEFAKLSEKEQAEVVEYLESQQ